MRTDQDLVTADSSAPKNNNQARERRVVVNLDEYRNPAFHGSRDLVRGSCKRLELIGEQVMSGDTGTSLDLRKMPGMDAGLAVEPLPHEPRRDVNVISEGGLAPSDLDGSFNSFSLHEPKTSPASHEFQEPGSWKAPTRANSLPSMSSTQKRPLTEEEKKAAELIKQAVKLAGKTQDKIAEEVGVSQGMIWQWMNAKLPVPAKKAQKLATSIGLHPSQVSVAWREVVRESKKLAWPFKAVDPIRWVNLSPGQKVRIEGLVLGEIVDIEEKESKEHGRTAKG